MTDRTTHVQGVARNSSLSITHNQCGRMGWRGVPNFFLYLVNDYHISAVIAYIVLYWIYVGIFDP